MWFSLFYCWSFWVPHFLIASSSSDNNTDAIIAELTKNRNRKNTGVKKTHRKNLLKKQQKSKIIKRLRNPSATTKITIQLSSASCLNSQNVRISKQTISTRLTIIL